MLRPVDDLLAIVREERTAIVAKFVGQLADMAAVGVHGVNVQVSMTSGGEEDLLSIAANGGLGVVAGRVGQAAQVAAVGLGGVDVIGVVDRPHVAARVIGFGRAFAAGCMGGREEDAATRGKEIA